MNIKTFSYQADAQGLRYLSFERGELERFLNSGEQRCIVLNDEGEICGFLHSRIIREVLGVPEASDTFLRCSAGDREARLSIP